ncbi:hypothetical protein BDF14DRAFT_1812902 [Spinellus fusiger]|nr:hypothetical protein BDF14DRAFT_1812902 [Spinellus fusiger]
MNPAFYFNQPGHPNANFRPGMTDPSALQRKRAQTKQGTQLMDENEEASGDELDDISSRDIAMARYKRNHDYLSEIFTPYNAASIVPPSVELAYTKEEILALMEEHAKKAQQQKNHHAERMKALEKERDTFWALMAEMNQTTTVEQMDAVRTHYGKEHHMDIEHTLQNVIVRDIPGIQPSSPARPLRTVVLARNNEPNLSNFVPSFDVYEKHTSGSGGVGGSSSSAMDIYSYQQTPANDETGSDYMFEEMVNASQEDDDDNPSMSEFLNTADMDFEKE